MVAQRLRNLIEDDFGGELPGLQEWQEIFGESPSGQHVVQRLATIERSKTNGPGADTDETVERPTSIRTDDSGTPTTDGSF